MAGADQEHRLDREGGVGGVGAKEPGGDERAEVTARWEALQGEGEDEPEGEAAREVGPERGPGEAVGGDVDDLGHAVAGRGTEGAAEGDGAQHRRLGPAP